MPKFRLTLEKYNSGFAEYWTNIYWCNVAVITDAVPLLTSLMNAERPLYWASTVITKGRVDDAVKLTDNFRTVTFNAAGTRASPTGDAYPLFAVSRVDFTVADGGRPSRKYLRATIADEDTAGATALAAAAVTRLQTYADAIVAAGLCDVDLAAITAGAVWPNIAMRQLRRGSKKRLSYRAVGHARGLRRLPTVLAGSLRRDGRARHLVPASGALPVLPGSAVRRFRRAHRRWAMRHP